MNTEKEILMFYHTTLRNVGLFTSISLALLGYSRFYRGKNKIYNISFIILSLLILLCAMMINFYLVKDLERMRTSIKDPKYLDKWMLIPKAILTADILIAAFGGYTLYREIVKAP